jgi:DNA-binding NarL/FixJ family response regulator
VLSVYDSDELLFGALDAGADGYFTKEIRGEELLAGIRAVYAGERRVSESLMSRVLQGLSTTPERALNAEDVALLRALAAGKTNTQIALERYMSLPTLKRRLRRIFLKLGVQDRTQAVAEAARRHML